MKTICLFAASLLIMVPLISHALLWDFNNKAQEADWEVVAPVCEIDDDAYKFSAGAEARAITGDPNWTDYTITCKARLTQAGNFRNIALLWRVSEGKDYLLMLEGGRQQAEWYKNVVGGGIGGYVSIKNEPLNIDIKDWFEFKVVVVDDSFSAYYDGELISVVEDGDLEKGGVGARVYGCTSHIDDFEVIGPGIPGSGAVDAEGKLATTWGYLRKL